MMEELIELLHSGGYSCVIASNGNIRTFTKRGVADLYDLFTGEPEFLRGALVADKVVGKGAAALMVEGGIRELYTDVISQSALALLTQAGVSVGYARVVDHIENREKNGWCPLEKSCQGVASSKEIVPIVSNFIAKIRGISAATVLLLTTLCSGVFAQRSSLSDTLSIPEVVVTGTRNATDIRHLPMSVTAVSGRQIEARYEPSLLPVLTEQVPGLFTTSRGIMGYGVSTGASGGMSMRGVGGSPTTGMLVLIDGHPQYMGLMGHPIADVYQSMLAEKVEVVRGPASVLYGSNAMGGVINIITKKVDDERPHGSARIGYGSYNTLTTEATASVGGRGFTAVVGGSYNRTDGHRERMGFEQYGGYAKVGYRFSSCWSALANVNLTHFNASNPGSVSRPLYDNDSKITRGVASLSVENSYANTSGAVKLFYNRGRHKIDDGFADGETPKAYLFNSTDRMLGATVYQGVTLLKNGRLTLGADYQQMGGRAWNAVKSSGTTTEIADRSEHEVAAYADLRQGIGSWVTLDAGIRYDHHSRTGAQWVPQLGVSVNVSQTSEVKLMASRGFRNPTIREMYMFPPQNPDLKPESLWSYEAAWNQRLLDGRLSYGISLYYINGKDMIQTQPVNGRPLNVNTGKIENRGAELSLMYRATQALSFSANYSRLIMEHHVVAVPEHKLFVGANLVKGRWMLATGVQYVKGLYTAVNPDTQENFTLWNVRGACRLTKWLEVYAKGENLLNQSYEINRGYPMPGATVSAGVMVEGW